MKFEVGKYYETRDGSKAFLIFNGPCPFMDMKNKWVWHGFIEGLTQYSAWNSCGRYDVLDKDHPNDLIREWREPITKKDIEIAFNKFSINSIPPDFIYDFCKELGIKE